LEKHIEVINPMKEKLELIAEKAKQDKGKKFTALVHHVNEKNLAECYKELKRNKASGIDGVTVEEYGMNLEGNLKGLVGRLKSKSYRSQPVRRVYIPKPGKKEKRGLGIPTVEDKLVQMAAKKILEAIYEQDFKEYSYGFRPNRSCHEAIKRLDKEVMTKPVNYIVEVDIKRFFDTVSHYWLQRCLEERIKDPNYMWLIRRFLKAGVIEEGKQYKSKVGTPQGGVISPLLANIYLHYVLDLWLENKIKPKAKGYMQEIRYCDDFVVCCETLEDAKEFLKQLESRLDKFGLAISPEKTKIVEFGRRAWKQSKRTGKKAKTFDFLGFTHYCATSRRGYFVMGHKTTKRNLCGKLKEIKEYIRKVRNSLQLRDWLKVLKAKLIGHYNYFGISGNYRSINKFYRQVLRIAFKWINRRSQRKSMNWGKFDKYLKRYPLPKPKIYVSLYTLTPKRGMLS
jgi:group II intron reverse transcriptase/maturase